MEYRYENFNVNCDQASFPHGRHTHTRAVVTLRSCLDVVGFAYPHVLWWIGV
jgi:alpha-D-ribose 1-methylphosphonate 5-triphosphate synthase subunit PhnG